jgi:hypothetical protein
MIPQSNTVESIKRRARRRGAVPPAIERRTRNEQVSGSSPLVGFLFFLQILQKLKASDQNIEGFVSSTSAVDYPEAPSLASVCCKWLQGTAGGVGGSSGMDRLTGAPGFR